MNKKLSYLLYVFAVIMNGIILINLAAMAGFIREEFEFHYLSNLLGLICLYLVFINTISSVCFKTKQRRISKIRLDISLLILYCYESIVWYIMYRLLKGFLLPSIIMHYFAVIHVIILHGFFYRVICILSFNKNRVISGTDYEISHNDGKGFGK